MKKLFSLMVLGAMITGSVFATDLSITAANVVPGARARYAAPGNAGVAITAGQLVYWNSTSQNFQLASASTSATTANLTGYAANSAGAGQPLVVVYEDDDVTIGATMSTSAGIYILSATAGGISPSAALAPGMYPVVCLVAKSTTKGIFRIIKGTVPATSYLQPLDSDVPRLASITRSSRAVLSPRRLREGLELAA